MGCWSQPTTKDAYRLSWISLFFTTIAAIAGIALFVTTGSSLSLVYGLENIVDFLSSAVVLWRFFAPSSLTPEIEAKLNRREKRASVAISIILMILGFMVIITAIDDFRRGQDERENFQATIAISFFSMLIFGAMAVVKFQFSVRLDSPSLYKDGVCSLIGTILAAALFIDTLIIRNSPGAWFIDPLVALLAGVGAFFYGIGGMWYAKRIEGLPIFSCRWWFTSQGDDDSQSPSKSGANRPGPQHFEIGSVQTTPTSEDGDDDVIV